MTRQKLIETLAEVEVPPPIRVGVNGDMIVITIGQAPREMMLGFSAADAIDFANAIRDRALVIHKRVTVAHKHGAG